MSLVALLSACSLFGLLLHLLTSAVIWKRHRFPATAPDAAPLPSGTGVSIVRPVSQLDSFLDETLESTFHLDWDNLEIIFCAARESDPAVPAVRRLLARHPRRNARLMIGETPISQNPKLNNIEKGWRAASHDLVALIDSNVLLPRDYLQQVLAVWDDGCGLVTSPPAGDRPDGFWAAVECAFLNTYQARWQLIADEIGDGFAQGKNLVLRKSVLEPLGGIKALTLEAAEDAAVTRVLRAAGYHVRLSSMPFIQPLGRRSFRAVWQRQQRWATLRRASFPLFYLPEIIGGLLAPLALAAAALWLAGYALVLPLGLMTAIWIAAELVLAAAVGWPHGPVMLPAVITRELLMPFLYVAGWFSDDFEWQGHAMTADPSEPATTTGGAT
jgi:ceramide glucosyltransferase